jgi:hypothetical protein
MTSGIEAKDRFGKQDFRYVAEGDVYVCPASEKLAYQRLSELCHQTAPYHSQGAADHPLGA